MNEDNHSTSVTAAAAHERRRAETWFDYNWDADGPTPDEYRGDES